MDQSRVTDPTSKIHTLVNAPPAAGLSRSALKSLYTHTAMNPTFCVLHITMDGTLTGPNFLDTFSELMCQQMTICLDFQINLNLKSFANDHKEFVFKQTATPGSEF